MSSALTFIRVELKAEKSIHTLYEVLLLRYVGTLDKRFGLLINCTVEKIRAGTNHHYCKRTQRGGRVQAAHLLIVCLFSVFSVVFF